MSRLNELLKPSGDFGDYHWQINTWSQLSEYSRLVREAVFVKEQQIPLEQEFDELDIAAVHIIVFNGRNEPIATARLIKSEKGISVIGRMAVLIQYRGEGIGRHMVRQLMTYARRRRDVMAMLNAQSQVVGFYKKLGFNVIGEPLTKFGITHVEMQTDLNANKFAQSKI